LPPALPAPSRLPGRDEESLRRMMNGGDKPRHLGAPSAEETEQPLFNEKTWKDFVAWAKTRFAFDEADCLTALEAVGQATLETPYQFVGSKELAVAALICAHCEYDRTEVEAYTSTKFDKPDYGLQIWELAQVLLTQLEPVGEVVEE